ncbi:UBX domain-containing protein 6 [Hypsibius exemplaris]|uniref:UBX domain-containing protein 6 n=1 Tax=Hypsibius exemplaris TaxID=2072580 RepID=A0A1W0WXG2_HYPEX|nr:UBX domain-containing protein 6 [Hypsibius exemplaris]
MSQLKKFFEKTKKDVKFKAAGQGHSLGRSDDRPSVQPGPSHNNQRAAQTAHSASTTGRPGPSDTNQRAAQAALARLEQRMGAMGGNANLLREVYTEMGYSRVEVEAGAGASTSAGSSGVGGSGSSHKTGNEAAEHPVLAVEGVFYKCPVIGPFVLPRDEMEKKIQEFLREQLAIDPTITSAVMLATFNKDKEKLQSGRETLRKYLENILQQPGEEKYRKIRVQNKAFQERVLALEAADKFLEAAGFQKVTISNEGKDEDFFQLPSADDLTDRLTLMLEYLDQAEPVLAELDRGIRVFRPSGAVSHFNLPEDFYSRTAEELQEEYARRRADLEKSQTLRTRAMREQDTQRSARKHRFTVLRIRMPGPDGGFILQGTFGAYEKLSAVEAFVRENLINEQLPFVLTTAVGNRLSNVEARLNELDLVPAAIMNFQSLLPVPPSGRNADIPFLKEESMALMQIL